MNKMMTALAIVLVAGLTQAASIDWTITGKNAVKNVGGTTMSGATVYLVLGASESAIALAINNGTFTSGMAGILGSTTLSALGNQTVIQTATSGLLTAGASYSYGILVFSENTYNAAGSGNYKFSLGYSQNAYTVGPDEPLGVSFVGTDFSGAVYTAYAVPEPTSMALLALGAAALGLRRKFRK